MIEPTASTQFKYDTDLAQFVSDFFRIDGVGVMNDDIEVAEAYIDTCLDPDIHPTDAEMKAEVNRLAEQIGYYR